MRKRVGRWLRGLAVPATFLLILLAGVSSVLAADISGVLGAAIFDVGDYAARSGNAGMRPVGGRDAEEPEEASHLICLDPGHQDHAMQEAEPNGPGSAAMKQKLTSGTSGTATGLWEYQVVLEIGLHLKEELLRRGYRVLMTRETNDVEISNLERAQMANAAEADLFIRLHLNSSSDSSVRGVLCYRPGEKNPYLGEELIRQSERLSSQLLLSQTAVTGQPSLGLLEGDDMTGINWARMPVTIVEMGFMSNPEEDLFVTSPEGQALIARGLADGVDAYFAGSDTGKE